MTEQTGISVSELNRMVSDAIHRDPRTRSVTVRGEISGFKHHIASGHWYFTLKDTEAAVACAMYRSNTLKAKTRPKDGDSVLVDGYVDIYSPQGKYQLYVTGIRSAGQGDMYIRLEALKRKLEAEGLFDPQRKRPLPLVPRKVAVVTSESGAALHDILNVSRMRNPSVPIVLIPVTVQGTGAGKEIAEGIRRADRETDADVIIVARGGGSAEDLWCFNEEEVARAVADSSRPVVSGVGHEIDVSLCDLAADVRASTPSNAAEIVFPDRKELRGRTGLLRSGLIRAQAGVIRSAEMSILAAKNRLGAISPEKRIAALLSRTALIRERLHTAQRTRLDSAVQTIRTARLSLETLTMNRIRDAEHLAANARERLAAVSPLAVLNRGYAMVYDAEEHLLTSAEQTLRQRDLVLQFADGRVRATRKDEI